MSSSFIEQFGLENTEEGLQFIWEAHSENWSYVTRDPDVEARIQSGELKLFAVRAVVYACFVELGSVWHRGVILPNFKAFLEIGEEGPAETMRESLHYIAWEKLAELSEVLDIIEGNV